MQSGAEVADTFAKQMVGLMYRDGIGKDEGMFFPLKFEGVSSGAVVMWNMRFNIDIVWLDSSRRIVDIFRAAKPCSSVFGCKTYVPRGRAKYVVELKAGTASKLGIKMNGKLMWNRTE